MLKIKICSVLLLSGSLIACSTSTSDNNMFFPPANASAPAVRQEVIYNPDMGFYSAETITLETNGNINKTSIKKAKYLDKNATYNNNATFDLIHLKIDISKCRNEDHLNLTQIETLLSNLEKSEQTCVIRFAYDKKYAGVTEGSGKTVFEPDDFSTILNHAGDICNVLKKHTRVITALECGMLGPWGEMHTTTFAESSMSKADFIAKLKEISPALTPNVSKNETTIEKGNIVLLMEKFLSGLNGTEIPFLVRQPNFIYNYLKRCDNLTFDGAKVPSAYTPTTKTRKLGIYNDGYLGSEGDKGTFRIDRTEEIAFLETFTNHTPYGGELIGKYSITGNATQLKNVHLSFLNIGWRDTVLKELDGISPAYCNGESIFKYILNYMGYRYVITESKFSKPSASKLKIDFTLENKGFAELPYHRSKVLKLYFAKQNESPTYQNTICASASGTFKGGMTSFTTNVTLPASLENTNYDVYLKICDSDEKYAIRLANTGCWNETIRANKLGTINPRT